MSAGIQSKAAQQGFGRRGPGLGAPTEKPKDGRQTLRRLLSYFRPELNYVISDKYASFSEHTVLSGSPKLPTVVPKRSNI